MDRSLASALTDLGLTGTEAEIYVALLASSEDEPVSAYKLAQDMGRDPANTTKTLGAMVKRGAVRASGGKPRLYQAVAPEDFTGELVARFQARQREAVAMLEAIGTPPPDLTPRPLETLPAALDVADRLVNQAKRVVLMDGAPEYLQRFASDLSRLVEREGASVLARSTAPVKIPGARVWVERLACTVAPGPWLRLAVDGSSYLELVAHPEPGKPLLHGHWSRSPSQAFMGHSGLVGDLVLSDVLELLREGSSGELAHRHAEDQIGLILRQVNWRERWRESGLMDYLPAATAAGAARADDEQAREMDPAAVAEAMAEIEREGPPRRAMAAAGGSGKDFEAQTPGRAAAEEADEDDDDDSGPLRFIFRRRRKN